MRAIDPARSLAERGFVGGVVADQCLVDLAHDRIEIACCSDVGPVDRFENCLKNPKLFLGITNVERRRRILPIVGIDQPRLIGRIPIDDIGLLGLVGIGGATSPAACCRDARRRHHARPPRPLDLDPDPIRP